MLDISTGFNAIILSGALGALIAFFFLKKWAQQFLRPTLNFSKVADFSALKPQWRAKTAFLPRSLLLMAFTAFLIALANPHCSTQKSMNPQAQGASIYLLLDRSSSMADVVKTSQGKLPKIDLLKTVVTRFIDQRPQDLLGFIGFARAAQVLSPLTLDHRYILDKLKDFEVVKNTAQNGTGIGYAIFKTTNLIVATRHYAKEMQGASTPYEVRNAAIFLVTDGFQETNPADEGNALRTMGILQAAQFAKEHDVRVYIINIEPALATEALAPIRKQMQQITKLTGGDFYLVDDPDRLQSVFQDVSALEESKLTAFAQPNRASQISLAPWLIALGMVFLFFSVLFRTAFWRTFP